MKRIDPNDPRLTAYALGELDEAGRAEFEKLLQESEEDRGLVAEYQSLADVLSQELASEPHPVLTSQQRGVIEKRLTNSDGKTTSGPSFWAWLFQPYRLAGACAACLIIGLGIMLAQPNYLVSRHTDELAGVERQLVAKGVTSEVKNEELFGTPAVDPPQKDEVYYDKVSAPTARGTLTESMAGRPLTEAGDQVVDTPEALALLSPPIEGVPVVVARADKGKAAGQAMVQESLTASESERISVVELPAQPAAPATLTEGKPVVASALTDLARGLDAAGGMAISSRESGRASGQVDSMGKFAYPSSRSSSSAPARRGSAFNEAKYAAPSGSAMAPSSGPSDGDMDSWGDLSSHSFSDRGADLYEEQSPSLGRSERHFASHRGALGQQPLPTTVGNANGGMGSGEMKCLIMTEESLQQQVAAGSGPQDGPADSGYYVLTPFGPNDHKKPEVITLTESEGVETYSGVVDNPFKSAADEPLSTFSIDVDTAAYSNLRRYLNQGSLPPKDAVRIEEMLNYFPYDYAPPTGEEPFATHVEVAECPWNSPHRLVRIGIKGKVPPGGDRPACNLVFLIDVSGSMQPENKLPLLKKAMTLLLNQLHPTDQVAIVTYASSTGLVLPSTPCSNKPAIQVAIDNLNSGGSTNGEGGIQLAYKTAEQTLLKTGINRVILATDGDFNVGVSDRSELEKIITDKAKGGVFLSVLGFGMGNLKDATLETLADKGNGNYAYIDTLQEARKVLVEQMAGTLMTIAKDVKIQLEFNPGKVGAYRLIGYENRVMAAQDFNDDRKDAGEIGAGHMVTALYEVVPVGTPVNMAGVDPLKYQKPAAQPAMSNVDSPEMLTVKLRYKAPDGDTSKLLEVPVNDPGPRLDGVTPDFKFTAAVASFGMLLRESPYRGTATFDTVLALAQDGKGADKEGYRTEFIQLVGLAKALKP